ncbi:MAG TPA: chemotaxis protein, partial [Campylobacterales bacterium]|nr:chemotaxis protein [Campylobacterales bacterium]
AFADVWKTIEEGKVWSGYIKNMRKDRGYYWVHAEVSGVYKDGKLVEYKSLRAPVEVESKLEMQKLYDKMRKEEEGTERVVAYLSAEQVEKLKSIL